MQIREYTERDRADALGLAPRLCEGVAPWRDQREVAGAVTEWVRESLDAAGDSDHAVFVAEDEDGFAGVVTVSTWRHFTGELDAYVGELVVRPRATGRGIGRALMQAAHAWARDRGLSRVTVETGAANRVARSFYAGLGYLEEDVRLSRSL